ncbi:unnamed protein product [Acanthoscelides obtectus]|nr:unnamed protein product [Acanthoscelides obtectus]CAK1641795.1 T-complex-associated testis-expressed protein 1 [Acanthoscelides obtectus]
MNDILDLCAPYTQRLLVTQLQRWQPPLTMEKEDIPEVYPIDHINLIFILRRLPQISELRISYGVNEVGEDFQWDMFKLSVTDCVRLGKGVLELKQIKILKVHRSNIEYKHCQALMQGLIRNRTLVELDLSNCKIGDQGALCVAKVISTHPTLKNLNLTNNRIGQIGAEGICYALTLETCARLDEVNFRLNPLGHEGVMGVLRAVIRCDIPRKLILSGVNFEEETSWKLAQMIKHNTYLEGLDISNNWLGEEGGEFLCEGMEINKSLKWLDLRETDITPAQHQTIKKLLKRNVTGILQKDEEIQSQQQPDTEEKVITETTYKAENAEEKEGKGEKE